MGTAGNRVVAFVMLILLASCTVPTSIMAVRLTDGLDPTSKGILLGAIIIGLIIGLLMLPRELYLMRARQADKAELMATLGAMRAPTIRMDPTFSTSEPPRDEPSFFGRSSSMIHYLTSDDEDV